MKPWKKKNIFTLVKISNFFLGFWKILKGIFLMVSPGQYLCWWWWNKIKWKVNLLLALKRMKRDMKINSVWTLPWILQWLTYCSLPSCHLYTNHLSKNYFQIPKLYFKKLAKIQIQFQKKRKEKKKRSKKKKKKEKKVEKQKKILN